MLKVVQSPGQGQAEGTLLYGHDDQTWLFLALPARLGKISLGGLRRARTQDTPCNQFSFYKPPRSHCGTLAGLELSILLLQPCPPLPPGLIRQRQVTLHREGSVVSPNPWRHCLQLCSMHCSNLPPHHADPHGPCPITSQAATTEKQLVTQRCGYREGAGDGQGQGPSGSEVALGLSGNFYKPITLALGKGTALANACAPTDRCLWSRDTVWGSSIVSGACLDFRSGEKGHKKQSLGLALQQLPRRDGCPRTTGLVLTLGRRVVVWRATGVEGRVGETFIQGKTGTEIQTTGAAAAVAAAADAAENKVEKQKTSLQLASGVHAH